jgi:hypothetical protein
MAKAGVDPTTAVAATPASAAEASATHWRPLLRMTHSFVHIVHWASRCPDDPSVSSPEPERYEGRPSTYASKCM